MFHRSPGQIRHESRHVLRRIAEEDADFVRQAVPQPETPLQFPEHGIASRIGPVTAVFEQSAVLRFGKRACHHFGVVEKHQRTVAFDKQLQIVQFQDIQDIPAVQTDRIAVTGFRRKTPPDAEQFAGLHAASDRRGLQQKKTQEAFSMKETGCRCHNFVLPNFQKTAESFRPAHDTSEKDKSRNHPANPVGKPNPHLHTLTSVFRSNPAGSRTQTERRTLFHILPFWTAAHLHQYTVNGSGTFAS